MAALACGMIAVGSANSEVTCTLLQALMDKTEAELKDTYAKFLPLGIGLTYLGKFCRWILNYNICKLYLIYGVSVNVI